MQPNATIGMSLESAYYYFGGWAWLPFRADSRLVPYRLQAQFSGCFGVVKVEVSPMCLSTAD
jgi:hypothetical protein